MLADRENTPKRTFFTANTLMAFCYLGILLSFACARLVIVSGARDPILMGVILPQAVWFQVVFGLMGLILALFSLLSLGLSIDRGSSQHYLAAVFVLPLVLILLEIVTLDL